MSKQTSKLISLIAAGAVPTASVVPALLAQAAPGDLDPAYGDLGRLGPILNGPAWSLAPQEDGTMLLAGGQGEYHTYFYWGYYTKFLTTNFVSRLAANGDTDPGFIAESLEETQVLDIARQEDGQVVAVGRRILTDTTSQLLAFRLQADGPLDSTFGEDGFVELSVEEHGDRQVATSVLVEPDGRIVVAGSRHDELLVLRLLPNGSFDDAFGTSGIVVGPATFNFAQHGSGPRTSILRTAAGSYRVTASNEAGCQVVALTSDGAIDPTFGDTGVATVNVSFDTSAGCHSLAAQADGSLLLAGHADESGFAARLLSTGQPDPGFAAAAVPDELEEATAVAASPDGSILVAGRGVSGASVMRLQASGELDALFGNGGSTFIDLPSRSGTSPVVHEMSVHADGRVTAAGGDDFSRQAFAVRLLGDGGGDSPGVLGTTAQRIVSVAEGEGETVVKVRRSGGATGNVSVAYATQQRSARDGEDYDGVSGRLDWVDGDAAEKEVRIPVHADADVEDPEYFELRLSDTQGGARLGTRTAIIEIGPDGSPHGQFNLATNAYVGDETDTLAIGVIRNYFSSGPVSVTVSTTGRTATTGVDYTPESVTLNWADGEAGFKEALFTIVDDDESEQGETFDVQLTDAAGGALIGPRSSAVVTIRLNSGPPASGGGAYDWFTLLVLGLLSWLGRLCAAVAARARPMRA